MTEKMVDISVKNLARVHARNKALQERVNLHEKVLNMILHSPASDAHNIARHYLKMEPLQ